MTNEAGYLIVFIRNLHSLSIPACTDQGKMESQLRLLDEAWVFFFSRRHLSNSFRIELFSRWITSSIRECAWRVMLLLEYNTSPV